MTPIWFGRMVLMKMVCFHLFQFCNVSLMFTYRLFYYQPLSSYIHWLALFTFRRSLTLDTTLAPIRPSMATKTTTCDCNLYCKACFWWICIWNWLAPVQDFFLGGFQWLDVIQCFTNITAVTVGHKLSLTLISSSDTVKNLDKFIFQWYAELYVCH